MKILITLLFIVSSAFTQKQMYDFKDIQQLNTVYKKYIYKYFIAYEKLNKNTNDKRIILSAFSSFQKLIPSIMTKNEQKAYWINLYNIAVIQEVINNYPLNSINDLDKVFQKKIVTVEGENLSLDELEKTKLRSFNDPRYHFAIVCAAMSCPNLETVLYEGNRINYQLESITFHFINDKQKNDFSSNVVMLSKLFDWYGDEFKDQGGIRNFINQYLEYKDIIKEKQTIKFQEFDWRLNGEVTARSKKK